MRWYDRYIPLSATSPALKALAAAERRLGSRVPRAQIRCFLVLEHSLALGTALHATPLIGALRQAVPGSRVVAAASGFGLGVLQGHPGLERLIATPSPLQNLPGAIRAMRAAQPFGQEPYAVLHSTGNGRTKVLLAAGLGGGHRRFGFAVYPELMEAPLSFDPARSQIANNLCLLEVLGHGAAWEAALAQSPQLAEPVVTPSPGDERRMEERLRAAGLEPDTAVAVLITQTSPTQRKGWRAERFRRIARYLWQQYGLVSVFGGAAAEFGAIEALREGSGSPTINLAGQTSLLELAALFGRARVAVTLDTGPMHLGRAMGTPMVIIAPAWSPPVEWLPLGNPRVRILKNLDLAEAPPGYVVDEVSADEVEAAVNDLLG